MHQGNIGGIVVVSGGLGGGGGGGGWGCMLQDYDMHYCVLLSGEVRGPLCIK